MANTTILNLPVAVGLDGSEYIPVVQGSGGNAVTKRATVSQVDLTGGAAGSVQSANTVFSGPTAGAPNYPTFRSMVAADLPPFLQNGTGATPRSIESKLRDTVSVKDFGAVGDGVTDDTAAIQAAINYAASVSGAVLLSGNTYRCNGQLVLQTNTTIVGPGKLVAGPVSGFPADVHLSFLYGVAKDNIAILNVDIDVSAWTSLPAGVASVRAAKFRRGTGIRVEGCKIRTTGGGPAFVGCKDIVVANNEVVATPVSGVTAGYADGLIDVWVEFDIDAERCLITNNIVKGNDFGRWGIMVTALTFQTQVMNAKTICIEGNIIEGMYYDAIWVMGRDAILSGISISGNVIAGARNGISISDSTGFCITGNSITKTTGPGIYLWTETGNGGTLGATGGTVTGNTLVDVATAAGQPVAIWIDGTSSKNVITNNAIAGSTHFFGLVVAQNAVENIIANNNIQQGRGPKFFFGNTQTKNQGNSYTPTITGLNNTASATLHGAHSYVNQQAGFVFFRFAITPTASAALTQVAISLPYAIDLSTFTLFGGSVQDNGETAFVYADTANDRAIVAFTPASNNSRTIFGWFSYNIA